MVLFGFGEQIQTVWTEQTSCSQVKIWSPLLEARKVAGSATYLQSEAEWIVLSFKVSLFIQFIQSWKQREFVDLVCLGIQIKYFSSE